MQRSGFRTIVTTTALGLVGKVWRVSQPDTYDAAGNLTATPGNALVLSYDGACSMLDRPVLTLLIEAFALLTSTSTTSSSLLSAMKIQGMVRAAMEERSP